MKISTKNGLPIVNMRTLIYLSCIHVAIGTNATVIKNIRSTGRDRVLQKQVAAREPIIIAQAPSRYRKIHARLFFFKL